MSNSKLYSNTGGTSVATLRGAAQFESVTFHANVAQIGIEVFSAVTMNAVGWTENSAVWHLYVRSGGSLSFGDASTIAMNRAAVAVLFLESNALCEIVNTQVIINNVTEFHLMSVLDFSTLHVMNSTISSNEIANVSRLPFAPDSLIAKPPSHFLRSKTAIFAYSSSHVHMDKVIFSDNTIDVSSTFMLQIVHNIRRSSSLVPLCIKKSLVRVSTNSTLDASNISATNNTNRGDLVFSEMGSTISVNSSNFTNNVVHGGMLVVVNSRSTATYKQVNLTENVGGTAMGGIFQSLEGSSVTLNRVNVQSNTFDVSDVDGLLYPTVVVA